MQMCVLEFVNRKDGPMFHLEHYIEGEYVKYNSNSGFVSEAVRCTPQVCKMAYYRDGVSTVSF